MRLSGELLWEDILWILYDNYTYKLTAAAVTYTRLAQEWAVNIVMNDGGDYEPPLLFKELLTDEGCSGRDRHFLQWYSPW